MINPLLFFSVRDHCLIRVHAIFFFSFFVLVLISLDIYKHGTFEILDPSTLLADLVAEHPQVCFTFVFCAI